MALLLLSCADDATPTPPVTASISPLISPTLSPTPLPYTLGTTALEPVSATALPVTPTFSPTPPATATVSPSPTTSPTATFTPALTFTPATTPGSFVPLQPVRRPGGTLKVGLLDDDLKAQLYSPYFPNLSEVSRHLQRLVWGASLIYLDPVRYEWRSLAATGLPTIDRDGRRFIFELRDGLTWSDGSPITPADYIYAFSNARLPGNRFPHAADLTHLTLETSQADPQTLIATFDDRYATALEILALIEPLPSRLWSRYAFANPAQNPEITHPTVVSGFYRPDPTGLTFQPFPNYFLGQANFDRISLKSFKYRAELNDALKTGQIDWSFAPFSGSDQEIFKGVSGLNVYRWLPQGADQRYIGYNMSNPFLQQKRVRQNLNRLLDTRSLIVAVEKGLAVPQTSFLPANNEYALKIAQPPLFNPRLTEDELKKLGYSQRDSDAILADATGKVVPPLDLIYPNDVAEDQPLSVYITQQYRQLGLQVTVERLEPATYLKRRAAGQYDLDLGLSHLTGAVDPDDYSDLFVTKGALNFTGYSNSQVDNLFTEGLMTDATQKTTRQATYDRLQRLLQDDSSLFFLYTLQAYTVMSSSLDPSGAGTIGLNGWLAPAWDAFPALLNWYLKET